MNSTFLMIPAQSGVLLAVLSIFARQINMNSKQVKLMTTRLLNKELQRIKKHSWQLTDEQWDRLKERVWKQIEQNIMEAD